MCEKCDEIAEMVFFIKSENGDKDIMVDGFAAFHAIKAATGLKEVSDILKIVGEFIDANIKEVGVDVFVDKYIPLINMVGFVAIAKQIQEKLYPASVTDKIIPHSISYEIINTKDYGIDSIIHELDIFDDQAKYLISDLIYIAKTFAADSIDNISPIAAKVLITKQDDIEQLIINLSFCNYFGVTIAEYRSFSNYMNNSVAEYVSKNNSKLNEELVKVFLQKHDIVVDQNSLDFFAELMKVSVNVMKNQFPGHDSELFYTIINDVMSSKIAGRDNTLKQDKETQSMYNHVNTTLNLAIGNIKALTS